MKTKYFIIFMTFFILPNIGWKAIEKNWIREKNKGYTLFYTSLDKNNKAQYRSFFENGIVSVKTFFNSPYNHEFNIFIHPYRYSLDSSWQKDWNMPNLKSECWMVASGVATKLDILSPAIWNKEACEHVYSEVNKTQQLITHELIHVFHGQRNISTDFSNTEGIDWFVEGLATYASGQCDASRITQVKRAIAESKIPDSLDNFWTGNIKYGLSGSIVMYIDHKFGRTKLKELLSFAKKAEILLALKITEAELLKGWKKYIENL